MRSAPDLNEAAVAEPGGGVRVSIVGDPMRASNRPPPGPPAPPLIADAAVIDWSRALPPAVPVGIAPIDQILRGGLRPESVYFLAAPSGKGKTGFCIQAARSLAWSRPLVYISSELSRRQVIARIAAQRYGMPWLEVYERPPEAAEALAASIAAINIRVEILRRDTRIPDVMRAVADETGQAPIMVLDYLQHAARRLGIEDAKFAVASMSDEVTGWARDAGSTALVISSVARGFYAGNADKRPGDFVGAGKESGDIEFDAAGVFFLDVEDCPPGGSSEARFHVAKHRFGPLGTIGLRFRGAVGLFEPDAEAATSDTQKRALDAIRKGATTSNDVAKAAGMRRENALNAIRALISKGLVRERERGLEVIDA